MSLLDTAKRLVGLGPSFPHAELALAQSLGISQDSLKAVRTAQKLIRGKDWQIVSNALCYSDAGQKKLLEALAVPPPVAVAPLDSAPNPEPPKAPAPATDAAQAPKKTADYKPPAVGEVRTLVCVRLVLNRHCVHARDGERPAWVKVKDNRKFRPGMKIQAVFRGNDQWDIAGRGPRFEGKY